MVKEIYADYSVLPRLEKIDRDFVLFKQDEMYEHFVYQKFLAMTSNQIVCKEHNLSNGLRQYVMDFIREKAPWARGSIIPSIAARLQEDIGIHCLDHEKDWLAYAHICFPSDWLPDQKVGMDFEEMHKPVPGMNLSKSRRMVEAMVFGGPFRRWVWSPVYDPWEEQKINYHPSLPKAKFNINNPHVHLKIESQVIWGIPEFNAALFVMKQNLLPFEEIQIDLLYESCYNMTQDEKRYKGVTQEFVDWLGDIK